MLVIFYYIRSFMSLDQQDMDLYETFQKNLRQNLIQSALGDDRTKIRQ